MKRRIGRMAALLSLALGLLGASALGQERRMQDYESELRNRVNARLEEYRRALLGDRDPGNEAIQRAAERARSRIRERDDDRDRYEAALEKPFAAKIDVHESNDGEGQDVELRLTMPADAFDEFAPIAALEAAAIPHKFPVVYIYLREETTDRVVRVAFRDAEPLAGRYLAGDQNAVDQMRDALIRH